MRRLNDSRLTDVRVEVVTTTFVASGRPEGIHDLGRFLETLNNPALARHIELQDAAVRPLYRAAAQVELEAPLFVRREDIVFANFEGPHYTRGSVKPATVASPALLMAPPFQISGSFDAAPGALASQVLRQALHGFFVVRQVSVYDAEGNSLGEGDQIVVNGAAVQMSAASRRHIDSAAAAPPMPRRTLQDAAEPADERVLEEAMRAA